MKRNIIRMLLAVLTCATATMSAWALEPNVQGVYELSSVDDLTAFSALVNGGQTNINAVLTQDINMPENNTWTPIAVENTYGGTIDGQGHTLTLNFLATSARGGALVGNLSGTVKNLTVAGIIRTEFSFAAGVVRDNRGGRIENVFVTVDFYIGKLGDTTAAGIAAVSHSGTISCCIFAGSMTGQAANSCGGIVGWMGGKTSISACANIAQWDIDMNGSSNAIARNPGAGTLTNCAALNTFGGAFEPGTARVAPEGIANGELCHKLNGAQSENPVWYQTLGEDALPVLDSSHGVVYANGRLHCDGSSYTETEYSNTNTGVTQDEHNYESGLCSYCGIIDENFMSPDEEGWFNVADADQLNYLFVRINNGQVNMKIRLTDDIDFAGNNAWITRFDGTLDGQGHTLTLQRTATSGSDGAIIGDLYGTVRNIAIAGSIATNYNFAASVVRDNRGGTVENVLSTIAFTLGASDTAGGIVAVNQSGTIRRCVFAGSMTGEAAHSCGGIVGWRNGGTMSDCINVAEWSINMNGNSNAIARNGGGNVTNSYVLDTFGGTIEGGTKKVTAESVLSGEFCWMLNGQSFINPTFFQTLGEDRDPCPVPLSLHEVVYKAGSSFYSFNIGDEESVQAARENMYDAEMEWAGDLIACKTLLDTYIEMVEAWKGAASFEAFSDAYMAAQPQKALVEASAAAYQTYIDACEKVILYLKEHSFSGENRSFLETYLSTSQEPGEDYPRGTYLYIYDTHELSDEEIAAEKLFVDQMMENAVAENIVAGMEVTKLLKNDGFAEGFDGWTATYDGGSLTTGGTADTKVTEGVNNRTMDVGQTLTQIPNGVYVLCMNGFFRAAGDNTSELYAGQLYLNGNANYLMAPSEDTEGEMPADKNACSAAFAAGRYLNYAAVEATDSTLTIGARNLGTEQANDWLVFGGVHVYYLGTVDEASEGLEPVLDSYVARAQTILDFAWTYGENYAKNPNISEALKAQLSTAIAERSDATTGESKLNLVNRFSALFGEVYACRKAYVTMISVAESFIDYTTSLYTLGVLDDDAYKQLTDKAAAAWDAYTEGTVSADEALSIAENLESEKPTITPDEEGVYRLSSASDVAIFSLHVNQGQTNVNACLTQDIDMSDLNTWIPIALDNTYSGTLDGQGHTLTVGLKATSNRDGALIGNLSGRVYDLTVAGTIVTNEQYAAGLVRDNRGGTIERVVVTVDFSLGRTGDNTAGGIVAVNQSGTIRQCIFAGSMTGSTAESCGGIVGWRSAGTISQCANIAQWDINMNGNSNAIARNGGSEVVNCAALNTFGGSFESGTAKVALEAIGSGELCYRLNGNQSTSPAWYQTLGEDDMPVTDSTHGVVYMVGKFHCDGTILELEGYANENTSVIPDHEFVDGICKNCGQANPEYKELVDGAYELAEGWDLYWFITLVNQGRTNANARLTQDIDFAGYNVWMSRFDGTLDGQSHTLTLQRTATSGSDGALIGDLYGTVRNLAIAGSIETNFNFAASVVRDNRGGTIENVLSTIAFTLGSSDTVGGIVAVNQSGTIRRCVFAGSMTGPSAHSCGGIVGWRNGGTVNNCANIGTWAINMTDASNAIARNGGSNVTNSYVLDSFAGSTESGTTKITYANVGDGMLCYGLNGGSTDVAWYQTLGEDAQPVLDSTHGIVYAVAPQRCDGTLQGDITGYANENTIPAHEYVDGICQNCGKADPEYKDVVDGAYELADAKELYWFITLVNQGQTKANARLTADIDFSGNDAWMSRFEGTLDGQGHTLTLQRKATSGSDGALIGDLYGTVCNLAFAGNIQTNFNFAASVARDNRGGTVEKVLSTVAFTLGASNTVGGIVAVNQSGTIRQCIFAGSMTGSTAEYCGGIVGWRNGGTMDQCASIAQWDIKMSDGSNAIARNGGSNVTNSYVLDSFGGSIEEGTTKVTAESVKSGELCYLLNGSSESIVWYQTIGEDEHPVLDSTHKVVYLQEDGTYSNDATGVENLSREQQKASGSDDVYDLQGRKVEGGKLHKGIYIISGRKVLKR
ncbi:MAG: hypothetical protein IJT48_01270 [Bacteroidaceae bacterium]|nr:hypothetical protein [Bacteroidaceae bacterium]